MNAEDVIRPTVRAVIRKGNLVLVQVKQSPSGKRYLTLPGGRLEYGETVADCVVRECVEEIGVAPVVGDVLHVADVFRTRKDGKRHLVEILLSCTVPDDYKPRLGKRPDRRQIQTIWTDPAAPEAKFFPRYDRFLSRDDAPVYLGRLDNVVP